MTTAQTATRTLIREAMAAQGVRAVDLAHAFGFVDGDGEPTSYIYNQLSGSKPFRRSQLLRLAELLHLDPDDLLFSAGFLAPDLEQRLKSDRLFLQSVRDLSTAYERR